jgi:tetratricopeptide (TPR) repeat protein
VAHTHAREYEQAAAELESLLDPQPFGRHNPQRHKVLLSAWQLGLLLHDELKRRVGTPQLALPGRRMEAIAAVERHLAENPEDQAIWNLKRILYAELKEGDYFTEAQTWSSEEAPDPTGAQPLPRFDHAYIQQLGLALINDNERWQRGAEYLLMAAHGLPAQAVSLLVAIGQAHLRNGNKEAALHYFEQAKRAGRGVGPKKLDESEAEIYYGTVKYLGDAARARGDVDAAIENYRLYIESPSSGLETLRSLADLCERKGDILSALRFNDMALVYDGKDRDLVERKDRYYYSLMPEVLQAHLENVRDGFDLEYCYKKTQTILDNAAFSDVEWLDVAHHLVQLALILKPEGQRARLLLARVRLRMGERDEALKLLEDLRDPKPEKFASGDDEDAWYVASQVLGDLYLEINRPDLAIPCFVDFRKSHRSGARTLYKLGEAYEQLGDVVKAARFYKQVTGYEGNPLVYDARAALSRLGT